MPLTGNFQADEVGNVVESYRFDAWGKVIRFYDGNGKPLAESAYGNRFLWQGREYSYKMGLYYFRARWYDPVMGRWLSNDPIGISGGLNQYVFCGNNPVNERDPFGLWNLWNSGSWGVSNGVGWTWSDSLNPLHESSGIFGRDGTLWGEDSLFIGLSQASASTIDGIIPFWDPFEIAYTDECGTREWYYDASRVLGAFSRNAYLAASVLRFYNTDFTHYPHRRGHRFPHIQFGEWRKEVPKWVIDAFKKNL